MKTRKLIIWYEENGIIKKRVEENQRHIDALLNMKSSMKSQGYIKMKVVSK